MKIVSAHEMHKLQIIIKYRKNGIYEMEQEGSVGEQIVVELTCCMSSLRHTTDA